MTRNELLRCWLSYYRAKGTADALAAIEKNLEGLKARMLIASNKGNQHDLIRFQGMAYGVHQHCRWLLNRRGGGDSP